MRDRGYYYTECISEAICDHDISKELSVEQIEDLAEHISGWVTGAVENESQAFGRDVADSNLRAQKDREEKDLKKALIREENAVWCDRCNGTGRIRIDGPCHYSMSDCYKCKGTGKIYNS